MNKKSFLLCVTIIALLGFNFVFYDNNKVDIYKAEKYAACIGNGTESSISVTASSTEKTSGVNYWYCQNYNTGAWETCPNSFGCSSYKITGWLKYDKIRVDDKAGNTSSTVSLYSSDYENPYGTRSNSNQFTENVGSNAIHIKNYYATEGNLTSATINSNGTIKLTGSPAVKSVPKVSTSTSPASSIIMCLAGKPVLRNGNYYCEAPSYRLQNDTCTCVYKKGSNKKYEFDTASGWKEAYVCERTRTYCSDEYNANASVDTTYNVITRRKENNQNAGSSFSNSNLYTRDGSSLCFTYYKKDGNGQDYYGTFPNDWYESFSYYKSKIDKYHNDSSYPPLPAKSGAKKLMVEASKNTATICNGSATGTTTSSNYYSSHSGVTYDGKEGVCNFILDKLNAGDSSINGITTSNGGKIVSIISSATCKFNSSTANKVGYSEQMADTNNNLLYYCSSGTISKGVSGYVCTKSTSYTVTTYSYDWTVNYYRK